MSIAVHFWSYLNLFADRVGKRMYNDIFTRTRSIFSPETAATNLMSEKLITFCIRLSLSKHILTFLNDHTLSPSFNVSGNYSEHQSLNCDQDQLRRVLAILSELKTLSPQERQSLIGTSGVRDYLLAMFKLIESRKCKTVHTEGKSCFCPQGSRTINSKGVEGILHNYWFKHNYHIQLSVLLQCHFIISWNAIVGDGQPYSHDIIMKRGWRHSDNYRNLFLRLECGADGMQQQLPLSHFDQLGIRFGGKLITLSEFLRTFIDSQSFSEMNDELCQNIQNAIVSMNILEVAYSLDSDSGSVEMAETSDAGSTPQVNRGKDLRNNVANPTIDDEVLDLESLGSANTPETSDAGSTSDFNRGNDLRNNVANSTNDDEDSDSGSFGSANSAQKAEMFDAAMNGNDMDDVSQNEMGGLQNEMDGDMDDVSQNDMDDDVSQNDMGGLQNDMEGLQIIIEPHLNDNNTDGAMNFDIENDDIIRDVLNDIAAGDGSWADSQLFLSDSDSIQQQTRDNNMGNRLNESTAGDGGVGNNQNNQTQVATVRHNKLAEVASCFQILHEKSFKASCEKVEKADPKFDEKIDALMEQISPQLANLIELLT